MKRTLLALALMAGLVSMAQAVTVSASNGVVHTTNGLTGFQTDGNEMVGMQVTATFANGGSSTATWVANTGTCGSASNTGWIVRMCGDTFTGTWEAVNAFGSDLITLLFDGQGDQGQGRTVFDRTDPNPGSSNSAQGADVASADQRLIAAAYSDAIAISPNLPVGDVYTRVLLTFSGFGNLSDVEFTMDTDNATSAIIRVPEPTSLALVGLGLLAAAGVRRKLA